ncbi:MAG: GDSL-type esterase/lipase family protein [Prevotella sp.]|nr:GDSL-type esterase/lipase family protein [Bacteroidales bacterium]MCM1068881.1 GDSL-type esterase/lipase family protein [Prevotella sp.]MCM1402573.1 GDSL-type esterase/lipase family protein [Bacteroides sp.]MCM1442464.1 GDSL-type esterase/lipase family protein [Muribaculum sp.]MCM1575617.1 GDSL-type esterase/lipase family protein [Bacteroides sp.]
MRTTPYYITLFIFSVITLLAGLSAIYPEDGISIGETTLRFPTLQSFLQEEAPITEPELSPEELIALRVQEMRIEEEQQFIRFFTENPARLHFPQKEGSKMGDSTYFDTFYTALEQADSTAVRIVHYGDSQIEEDRITSIIRQRMQEQFGGGGVGIVPLYQSVQSITIGQSTSYEPQRYMIYGNKLYRRSDSNLYGPMGQVAQIDSTISMSIRPRSKQTGMYSAHYFNQVKILTSSDHPLTVVCKGQTINLQPGKDKLRLTTFNLSDSTTLLNLTLKGEGDIYGVMLDNVTGVNVDNIPMRGCSGTIFTGINATQLRSYFQQTATRLIILQYGGNNMPYMKTTESADKYIASLIAQIAYLQHIAPNTAILFVGPSDMSTRIQGQMQTYPILPEFDQRLANAVTQQGVAYWSMYDAMGGRNAMLQWVRSGLAGSDYIHFSRKGANEIGDMLSNALFTGYHYYSWRKQQQAPSAPLQSSTNTLNITSNHRD